MRTVGPGARADRLPALGSGLGVALAAIGSRRLPQLVCAMGLATMSSDLAALVVGWISGVVLVLVYLARAAGKDE